MRMGIIPKIAIISFFSLSYSIFGYGNVVGVDTQNFNPLTSGLDFVTVHSSETLQPGVLNMGFFLNHAVNTLPNYEDTASGSRVDFVDSLTSVDMNFGLGLTKDWEVGMSFPAVMYQHVSDKNTAFRGEFEATGLTDIRWNTKYRFVGDETYGLAAILSMSYDQIKNSPFSGLNPGPTTNVELAFDFKAHSVAYAVNAGYRFRNPGDPIPGIPVDPFGNQWIASLGASYLMPKYDTKIIAEIFGSFPSEEVETASDRDLSSAEFLLGVKTDATEDVAFHFGMGTEIFHGSASPDWRIYTGLNWNFGPLFSKPQALERVEPVTAVLSEDNPFEGLEASPREHFILREVQFQFNSSNVPEDMILLMKRLVGHLKKSGVLQKLVVEGHTDSVGPTAYNQMLSENRAEAVRDILVNTLGLDGTKVVAVGFGETKPSADNGNYQGRRLNRRVEIRIERDMETQ